MSARLLFMKIVRVEGQSRPSTFTSAVIAAFLNNRKYRDDMIHIDEVSIEPTVQSILSKYVGEPLNLATWEAIKVDILTILHVQKCDDDPNYGKAALDLLYELQSGTYRIKV